ncbi:hypothetical protein P7K49_028087 [Saguinus oedipus]|uniref:Uncharacterized protein n=1 Tax=Saguinus oedipus TaxID=9490 RepID=A0ABQ9UBA8_SAGOE|nr:hypothetical protein P7K49_028087 [Saguinus oedipus]
MALKVMAAEVVTQEVMVDRMDLEVMVATTGGDPGHNSRGSMLVVDQDVETKVVDMMAVVDDMTVTVKEEMVVVGTAVVVGTI